MLWKLLVSARFGRYLTNVVSLQHCPCSVAGCQAKVAPPPAHPAQLPRSPPALALPVALPRPESLHDKC